MSSVDLPTIRVASVQDARAIAEVHVASTRSTYGELFTAEYLASLSIEDRERSWSAILADEKRLTLVATHGDLVVGFANGGANRGNEPFSAELYAIYLHADQQRMGIGKRLVAAFGAEMSKRGHGSMIVWVLADNPSRAFYESLGGSRFSTKMISAGGRRLEELSYVWQALPTPGSSSDQTS